MLEREQQTSKRDEETFQRLQQTLKRLEQMLEREQPTLKREEQMFRHLQQTSKRLEQMLEREQRSSKREERTLLRWQVRYGPFGGSWKGELEGFGGGRLSAEEQVVGLGQGGESSGELLLLRGARRREAIGMSLAGELAEGAFDLFARGFEGKAQRAKRTRTRRIGLPRRGRLSEALGPRCAGRCRPGHPPVTSPRPPVQVIGDREGSDSRAMTLAGDVEADPGVRELEERLELAEELLSKNRVEGLPGDEALFQDDFARELAWRLRDSLHEPPLPLSVEQPRAPQQRPQRRPPRGRVERQHASLREVDAVGRPEIFGQLEHAIGAGAMERAQQVSEGRSPQPAGKLHAVSTNRARIAWPSFGRGGRPR